MSAPDNSAEFWNAIYADKAIAPARTEHPVAAAALSHFGDVAGKRLLDLGCGTGEFAIMFAALGAEVVAIDRSETSVSKLQAFAEAHGLANLSARCLDARDLPALGEFDLVFGTLILHHIEPFDAFASELTAAMRPGGKGFFHENNAAIGAPALWFREHLAGKLWFPKYGDADEFPLMPREVAALRRGLNVEITYPELAFFRLISQYVFRNKVLPRLHAWLDAELYRFDWCRKFSYFQYLFLSRP